MQRNYFKQSILVLLMIFGLFITSSYATDGYFSNGIGVRYKAMAGAGVAWYLSPMAGANNPAAPVFYGNGYDISVSYFNPNRGYTVTGGPSFRTGTFGLAPGTVESGSTSFFIPSIGANWMIGEKMAVGVSIYGNGGMNTDYDHPTFGFQTTGVDLAQLFIAPNFAININDKHAVGVSPLIGYQRFQANGLLAFGTFSSDASNLSNKEYDSTIGFGAKIGYLGQFSDIVSFGAAIQTPVKMGEFENYAGLFAEGGNFDIPMNWTAGIGLQFDKLGIALDVKQIMYSGVKSISNPLLPNLQTAALGTDDGAGFGWEDMTVVKVGASYMVNDGLTLRAGASFSNQPIPDSEVLFNIVAPAVSQTHVTFGLTKAVGDNEINFVLMHALSNTVSGANPLEIPGQQTIDLTMDQWEIGVGFTF